MLMSFVRESDEFLFFMRLTFDKRSYKFRINVRIILTFSELFTFILFNFLTRNYANYFKQYAYYNLFNAEHRKYVFPIFD